MNIGVLKQIPLKLNSSTMDMFLVLLVSLVIRMEHKQLLLPWTIKFEYWI